MKKDKNALSENINLTEEQKKQYLTDAEVVFDEAAKGKQRKSKKPTKVYKKTTFKHKMKVLGVLTLLGMFTGCGLGVWYFNQTRSTVDYNLDPAIYQGNVDDAFASAPLSGITKGANWVTEAKAAGLTPLDITPINNILLCEYNAQNASSYIMIGRGSVTAMGVPQAVYSAKKYDGNAYTFESISSGMLTVATCDYMEKGGSTVTTYQGTDLTDSGATWITPESKDADEFEETVGVMPSAVSPYLISESTKETETEITHDAKNDTYSFTITLKTVESALLYYKQVKRSGGLEADPEFYSIEITFTINSDWQFVSSSIVESYKAVKFGLPVSCSGTLATDYLFNQEVTLPV